MVSRFPFCSINLFRRHPSLTHAQFHCHAVFDSKQARTEMKLGRLNFKQRYWILLVLKKIGTRNPHFHVIPFLFNWKFKQCYPMLLKFSHSPIYSFFLGFYIRPLFLKSWAWPLYVALLAVNNTVLNVFKGPSSTGPRLDVIVTFRSVSGF